jgi:hypothetical protein
MSPDRLDRHDHPPDEEIVTWGNLRELTPPFMGRVRHAVVVGTAVACFALLTALALAVIVAIQLKHVNDNTSQLQTVSCQFIGVLEDSGFREHELARSGPDRMTHQRSADYFDAKIAEARKTVHCPPPQRKG